MVTPERERELQQIGVELAYRLRWDNEEILLVCLSALQSAGMKQEHDLLYAWVSGDKDLLATARQEICQR